MPTICARCEHLYIVNKNDPSYRWLCMAKKREPEMNYQTGLVQADPPYLYCRHINYGACIHFDEDKHPQPAPKEEADAPT